MKKIFEEVRAISSEAIAKKQTQSENAYPKIIERIKQQTGYGKTEAEFSEHEIDQYSKRLLEQDGFTVYATTKTPPKDKFDYFQTRGPISVWIVRW